MGEIELGALRDRVSRLGLVHPLETLLMRALGAESSDGCHERLVYAWEVVIQITASVLWATCRARNPCAATVPGLMRPSIGHWQELMRKARKELTTSAPPQIEPILRTFGLRLEQSEASGFRQLADRIAELRCREQESLGRELSRFGQNSGAPTASGPRLKTIWDVLNWLPYYRNLTRGHDEPDTEFRRGSVPALAESVVRICELGLPLGTWRVVVVGENQGGESMALMHGIGPIPLRREENKVGQDGLLAGNPYLHDAPDRWVDLHPAAAACRQEDAWILGWLRREVRVPILSYQPSVGPVFSLRVDRDSRNELIGDEGTRPVLGDETLRLDPWRGLLPYGEEHSALFFGRRVAAEQVLSRLEVRRAAVICGASGVGKSSLMLAGVLPRLRHRARADWRELEVAYFQPGARPLHALREALVGCWHGADWERLIDDALRRKVEHPQGLRRAIERRTGEGKLFVLLVDQLEEAVGALAAGGEHFLDLVAAAARQCPANARIVMTVRADRLDKLLHHRSFREMFSEAVEPLGGLDADELADVIKGPLSGRDVIADETLVKRVIEDAGQEPGALALVSQSLLQMWLSLPADERVLTVSGYEAFGGLAGVVTSEAEAAREQALERSHARHAARILDSALAQLVALGEHGLPVRRKVPFSVLAETLEASPAHVRELLEPFLQRRLLVAGSSVSLVRNDLSGITVDPTYRATLDLAPSSTPVHPVVGAAGEANAEVQVSHETMFTSWPRYRELVDHWSEAIRLRQDVEKATARWEAAGRKGELWSDNTSRLRRAEELDSAGLLLSTQAQRAFLIAGRRAVLRRQRVAWLVAGGMVILTAVASGVGWMAVRAQRRAEASERDAREAEAERRHSVDLTVLEAAASMLPRNPTRAVAMLLQLETDSFDVAVGARTILMDAEQRGVQSWRFTGHPEFVVLVGVSPDAGEVAAVSADGLVVRPGNAARHFGNL
jgi:Novel STAND NTPase 1